MILQSKIRPGVSHGIVVAELDGVALQVSELGILLMDDSATHRLRVVLGSPTKASA
jgi:hypothetical protein